MDMSHFSDLYEKSASRIGGDPVLGAQVSVIDCVNP